jgi:hypothetical protein
LKIRFAKQAAKDLDAAKTFWRERRPDVVCTIVEDVIALAEKLSNKEFEGPELRLKSGLIVRSWPMPPYRVFYRRREDVLEILRVYHQARRPITR